MNKKPRLKTITLHDRLRELGIRLTRDQQMEIGRIIASVFQEHKGKEPQKVKYLKFMVNAYPFGFIKSMDRIILYKYKQFLGTEDLKFKTATLDEVKERMKETKERIDAAREKWRKMNEEREAQNPQANAAETTAPKAEAPSSEAPSGEAPAEDKLDNLKLDDFDESIPNEDEAKE